MYFSGEDSKDITFNDPDNKCIKVYGELYLRVLDNNEQNTRIF